VGTLIAVGFLLLSLSVGRATAAPARPSDVDILHFDVTVTPDFDRHSITGETRISFRSRRDALTEIRFSPNALTIDRASVDESPVRVSREAVETVLALPQAVPRGRTATLTIVFHGVPARGLVFGTRSVYTTYFTCDWMFCMQDRPGDKATINLTLRLPKGMTSVGVGARHAVTGDGPDTELHVWRETKPYSSYLYGFAAGTFNEASESQGSSELVYLSESAPVERLRRLFAGTATMLRFFEDKAGIPLPHERYVQLHVSGSAAQEADNFSLIGDDIVSPVLEHPQEDWAIAHELAHQWWGNLVTCADWNEFWLNEGITTFMVAAWKEQRWGRVSYDREMNLARQRVSAAAAAGIDVPLTFRGPFPSLSARRAIQYSKGALFIDRLRAELGEPSFWRGLREFTRSHAGSTVVTRDFQRALERASGRDLDPLFDEWAYLGHVRK
jgi:aminopeptidase N